MQVGPVSICGLGWWKFMYRTGNYCGIFRNKDGVMPGRWGFYVLGFELGSRNAGNWFGVFLKNRGLWPW